MEILLFLLSKILVFIMADMLVFLLSRNVGVSVGHLGGLYAVIFTFIHAGIGPCVPAGKNVNSLAEM